MDFNNNETSHLMVEKNLNNLTLLWQLMGREQFALSDNISLNISNSWPHRVWLSSSISQKEIASYLNQIDVQSRDKILSVWQMAGEFENLPESNRLDLEKVLSKAGYELSFRQTAMYLSLPEKLNAEMSRIELKLVEKEFELLDWLRICEKAFGYLIDESVIRNLLGQSKVEIIVAHLRGVPVGTALLFYTEEVCGVHQVSIDSSFQGQGIATQLMKAVIKRAVQRGSSIMTLQASEAGQKLYRNLGFIEQFPINNFQKNS